MTFINWRQYRFYFSWLTPLSIPLWDLLLSHKGHLCSNRNMSSFFPLSCFHFGFFLFFFTFDCTNRRRAPIISYYPLFQILKWIRSIADIGNWSFQLSLDYWKGMCLCRTVRAGAVSPLSLSLISSLESFSGVFAALFQSVSVTSNSNKPRWSHRLLRHANNYVKTYPT